MSQHQKKDKDTNAIRPRKGSHSQQQQQHQQQHQQQPQQQSADNVKQKASSSSSSALSASLASPSPPNSLHQKKSNGGINSNKLTPSAASTGSAGSSNAVLSPPMTRKMKTQNKLQRDKERAERASLVLWRRPVRTVRYCFLELAELLKTLTVKLLQKRLWIFVASVVATIVAIAYHVPGPHQLLIELVQKNTWFFVYWVGLGVLSSVGLGTGLHTFLLYLGPHIASVTLAAYECNSLNFPKPPYPDDIICPEEPYVKKMPNLWNIMSKVRLEAFLWGAGTALGELPPYFMAKAARLSGYDPDDDEELAEFEALQAKSNQKDLSLVDRGKLFMERVVERVGFFGILASASIPNPLFDLAGITCGHFLVPFWTFFGATLIGKAVVKMHLQKIFVIIAFNETLIERAVDKMGLVPLVGKKLQEPFKGFLNNQKQRLHRQRNAKPAEAGNLLSRIFETFVIGMVCYFVISIVNSLAQSYHKRLHKKSAHGGVARKQRKAVVRE